MTVPFAASAAGLAHRTTAWLATQPGDYDPSTGKGPDWGKAAPIGLLIILLLGAALFFLIKSMNKNLRRVPASFDPPVGQSDPAPTADDGAAAAPAADGLTADVARSDSAADAGATSDGPRPPR